MTGSGIFTNEPKGVSESDSTTGLRYYQQTLNGVSQISFSADGNVSPKKPTTLTEVAKQRELSGNLLTEADLKSKKQISSAKIEEISGHNIFGPPTEIQPPRSLAAAQQEARRGNRDMGEPAPRNLRTSVKVSNPAGGQSNILFSEEPEVKTSKKIHDQKFQELTGNGIFKGDESPGTGDKQLSSAKLREMSGNNIFADGKSESRDYFGGVRKPPGDPSLLLKEQSRRSLYTSLPALVQGRKWVLLYSTWRHGISLSTLYRKSQLWPGLSLLVVGDKKGSVFGGLVEAPLIPTDYKYQGTNNTFVFTDKSGQPTVYHSTGANRFYTLCSKDFLALGGGGRFALYLDSELLHGSSACSETYGNSCLANSQDFDVKEVELWGFVYGSKYDEVLSLSRKTETICRWS
ncbi:hypothetical protein F2Q70_00033725 [Brassica cretica]|uniref:TLDc domain-containing protein n=1 Tax=Brassica cretica TaxID=69181 RepID=A0A8S9K0E9_BRACR|nr:hypothetical protein F2Q70_00033725 [Brassica cretica]